METINFAEQKISLAQTILSLNDVNKMYKIQSYVNKILKFSRSVEDVEDIYDAKKLSFSEWNEQFDDERDLNTYLPEYGMKLLDFRFKIYNSERQNGVSKEEFMNRVKSWK